MHGRVKVRTTEEERERKKKEHALKVRAYRAAMGRILKKRDAGELDDEMLGLTVQILHRNPDVSTLWNIRRECVLEKIKQLAEPATESSKSDELQAEAESAAKPVEQEDKLQSVYGQELTLTEQCLMVNPKSYNAWHHRCWTLEQNPQADWEREVQLCNKYLKYDERNFHTWDYRRYVTAKAGVPAEQELDFCTEKIKVNFSNYSSWHHRSLLLPKLYPNEQRDRPMSEEKLQEELEMVLTAAFTDPNDSSAWFYQRWLLGGGAQVDQAPKVVAFRMGATGAVVAFNKPCPDFEQFKVELASNERSLKLESWQPADSKRTTWRTQTSIDYQKDASYYLKLAEQEIKLSPLPTGDGTFYFVPPHAASSCSKELFEELQTQLKSCYDLLEYEPDSKWTLLTSALLMRAIDVTANHERSLDHLVQLQKVDALREGYYKDLAACWTLELELAKWVTSPGFPKRFELTSESALTSLPYGQYLAIADELGLPAKLKAQLSDRLPQTFAELKL
ncbi:geranylgeranyl transferase type-2 subunit alpha [Drosophila guanche]|uniref:Geranylgeranyl transferase type-2 subunit alpha n=1 Tax=Drosophila guanche TaxID=7266 RepID=A0A3B0JR44_DROGU|nr:geranylgeranyl transferase type-2 subunit alpha [Drosophila guanche]SPP84605.1 blast:Geranylgeranyl transferase type-2 subunit alpha [Drosophila guanche]